MRDPNSRRRRASHPVRRNVSRGGVPAPRVHEEDAKDSDDTRVTLSSGNVFLDIGVPRAEAEHLLIRSRLMMAIERLIKERGLTQTRAARLFGVSQPRVSDLVRGRIELFTIDSPVEMLARAGIGLSIRLETRRRPA